VALKEMIPQPGLDSRLLAQLRDQFQQEAIVLARLNHPHLVGVTDFFEEEGNAYLVMKFIEGESLDELIKREGALPESQVLAWAGQLLDALGYCHGQGVIHRDVKPQNVIIQPDGQAVLVDFGLVKLWNPHDPRTRTAIRAMGTPEYAPPEQYDVGMGHTDARSDIYSLGATLYHALTGQAPPTATQRIVDPAALREVLPGVSATTEAAVMRALELRPAARFQSAGEMAAALGMAVAAPVVPRRQPTEMLPSRATHVPAWMWVLGGLVVLGLVAMLAVTLSSSGGQPAVVIAPTATAINTPGPTVALTHTPKPTVTLIHTPKPTATSTPRPTNTPQSTPIPTMLLQPTSTPTCPAFGGPFETVWDTVQDVIGCASGSAITGLVAEESFQGGKMFWREPVDYAQILVLFNDGTWQIVKHSPFVEGSPEFSCPDDNTPSQCPPTPKRGFGMVWCDTPEIRSRLGNATDCERGYQSPMQQFERGFMLQTDSGATYVFYDDGWWERR